MDRGSKFIPYLEKRIEVIENHLRDKIIMITNQDNRDLDVYMVGKLDACQELLNQIKVPAFYL